MNGSAITDANCINRAHAESAIGTRTTDNAQFMGSISINAHDVNKKKHIYAPRYATGSQPGRIVDV